MSTEPVCPRCDEGLVYITAELRKALDLAKRGIPFRIVDEDEEIRSAQGRAAAYEAQP